MMDIMDVFQVPVDTFEILLRLVCNKPLVQQNCAKNEHTVSIIISVACVRFLFFEGVGWRVSSAKESSLGLTMRSKKRTDFSPHARCRLS
jgi:hypothetical protein